MTLMISFGKYGGFYFHRGYSWRLCLGWMALTFIPEDDEFLAATGLVIRVYDVKAL